MPDREREVDHLALAISHIAKGEERLARLEELLERVIEQGGDAELARQVIEALRDTLVTFRYHRTEIAKTIDDLRSGKLDPPGGVAIR